MLLAAPQTNLWWTTKWYVSGPKMSSSIFHAREQSLMIAVENDSPSRRIERGVPSRWWSWENQEEAWNGQIDRKRKSRIIGWSWYEIFDWFLIYLSQGSFKEIDPFVVHRCYDFGMEKKRVCDLVKIFVTHLSFSDSWRWCYCWLWKDQWPSSLPFQSRFYSSWRIFVPSQCSQNLQGPFPQFSGFSDWTTGRLWTKPLKLVSQLLELMTVVEPEFKKVLIL